MNNSIFSGNISKFVDNVFNNWLVYLLAIQKGFFIVLSLIYTIFAIVIVRQVSLMSKNVQDKFNSVLVIFSYIHLVLSILLIIFTLILL